MKGDCRGSAYGVDRTAERGAVMPLMAIAMVLLLGFAAMAVDLGWLYWNRIDIQHGADAAALAGVIYEPEQRTDAHTEGVAAARENGFIDTGAGGSDTVSIIDFIDDPTQVEHDSQLRATITHPVQTFFMKIFGITAVDVSRTAVAQYALPIALGSPDAYLGADPSRDLYPGFWLSVAGTWLATDNGDRYGMGCLSGSGCPKNPEHRPSTDPGLQTASGGYVYGIDVPAGATNVAVEIFDGRWYDNDSGSNLTRDNNGDGLPTWFMLYGPDPTPLDTTDNELLCSVRYDPGGGRSGDVAGWNDSWEGWDEVSPQALIGGLWDDMRTSSLADYHVCAASLDRGPGIYPLRIMIEHSDTDTAKNKFSLRASTTGPDPRVYGLGDMSAYALPGSGTTTKIYLAEVGELHAGKNLRVELWDVGDVDGGDPGDELSFLDGAGDVTQCSWESDGGDSGPLGPCTIDTSAKRFNDELLTITIPIPDDYTCSGLGCWYQIDYQYENDVHDTTTWTVFIDGDPLRIVE